MGALKVMKALEEHTYIKNINRRVRECIRQCHICQLPKCNNEKTEGIMQPITSTGKLERVFLDVCGPVSYTHLDVYKRQIETDPVNQTTGLRRSALI